MIQGLNSKDSADRICEELKKIVGINKIEIYFETGQMILEADYVSMPRIINAIITITSILWRMCFIIPGRRVRIWDLCLLHWCSIWDP